MTQKHTPGPWEYGDDPEGSDKISVHARDDQYYICLVDHGMWQEDNARLIAAAPETYEALVELERLITDQGFPFDGHMLTLCRAALSKAKGTQDE